MLGIISAIIAWKKRRPVYALAMAGWSIVSIICAVIWFSFPFDGTVYPPAGPGVLFLIIAVCMKKESDYESVDDTLRIEELGLNRNGYGFICTYCGSYISAWYKQCPSCKSLDRISSLSAARRQPGAEDGQREICFCRDCLYTGSDLSPAAKPCPKCGGSLLKTGLSLSDWRTLSGEEKDALRLRWQNGWDLDDGTGPAVRDAVPTPGHSPEGSVHEPGLSAPAPAAAPAREAELPNSAQSAEEPAFTEEPLPSAGLDAEAAAPSRTVEAAAVTSAPNFCHLCGKRLVPGANFCTGCGNPVLR